MLNKKILLVKNQDSLEQIQRKVEDVFFRLNQKTNELIAEAYKKQENLYYIGLNNYSLNADSKFFIKDGKYNLAYVKWDPGIKRGLDSPQVGQYERKEIPVRYSSEKKLILIPTSERQYRIIDRSLEFFIYLKLFFFTYFFIGLPIQILVNISKGNAFDLKNIRRLKLIAYLMLGYATLKTITPYLLNIIYAKTIPPEFSHPPFSETFIYNAWLFLVSAAIFIVAKAFERGHNLQHETSLTI